MPAVSDGETPIRTESVLFPEGASGESHALVDDGETKLISGRFSEAHNT